MPASQNEDINSPVKSQETTHRSFGKIVDQRVVIKKRSDPLVQREKMKRNINYLERKIKPLLSQNQIPLKSQSALATIKGKN